MVENIDENVGQLLGNLDKWGLMENTVIIFMSDNGTTGGGAGKIGKKLGKSQYTYYNAGMKGMDCRKGCGEEKNMVEAYKWFGLAVEYGSAREVALMQRWPVKIPIRCYSERLRPADVGVEDRTLVRDQRLGLRGEVDADRQFDVVFASVDPHVEHAAPVEAARDVAGECIFRGWRRKRHGDRRIPSARRNAGWNRRRPRHPTGPAG